MGTRIQKAVEGLEKLYGSGGFQHLSPRQFFTTSRIGLAMWDLDKTQNKINSRAIRAWLTTYRPAYL